MTRDLGKNLSERYAALCHAVEGEALAHRAVDSLKPDDYQEILQNHGNFVAIEGWAERVRESAAIVAPDGEEYPEFPGLEDAFSKVIRIVPLLGHYRNGDLESAGRYAGMVEEGHEEILNILGLEDDPRVQRLEYGKIQSELYLAREGLLNRADQ